MGGRPAGLRPDACHRGARPCAPRGPVPDQSGHGGVAPPERARWTVTCTRLPTQCPGVHLLPVCRASSLPAGATPPIESYNKISTATPRTRHACARPRLRHTRYLNGARRQLFNFAKDPRAQRNLAHDPASSRSATSFATGCSTYSSHLAGLPTHPPRPDLARRKLMPIGMYRGFFMQNPGESGCYGVQER